MSTSTTVDVDVQNQVDQSSGHRYWQANLNMDIDVSRSRCPWSVEDAKPTLWTSTLPKVDVQILRVVAGVTNDSAIKPIKLNK